MSETHRCQGGGRLRRCTRMDTTRYIDMILGDMILGDMMTFWLCPAHAARFQSTQSAAPGGDDAER